MNVGELNETIAKAWERIQPENRGYGVEEESLFKKIEKLELPPQIIKFKKYE